MTESKHTPGPWYGKAGTIYAGPAERPTIIARMPHPRRNGEGVIDMDERYADWKLIASAPDLLKALEELIAAPDKKRPAEVWQAAQAAIAKARGVEA